MRRLLWRKSVKGTKQLFDWGGGGGGGLFVCEGVESVERGRAQFATTLALCMHGTDTWPGDAPVCFSV